MVSASDRKAFASLKPGDWGVYPCPDCGQPIEDEYAPDSCCTECAARRRLRRLEAFAERIACGCPNGGDISKHTPQCLWVLAQEALGRAAASAGEGGAA